jgi:hypothetical protein
MNFKSGYKLLNGAHLIELFTCHFQVLLGICFLGEVIEGAFMG